MTLTEFLLARIAEDEAPTFELVPYDPPVEWGVPAGFVGHRCLICETTEYGGTPEAITEIALQHEDTIHQHQRVLAECKAKRAVITLQAPTDLGEWTPDCGGDWVLSGPRYFANYWPDDTVSASIYDRDDIDEGEEVVRQGIIPGKSRAHCMTLAEEWIRANLADANPVLRALAQPYADHPDFDPAWLA